MGTEQSDRRVSRVHDFRRSRKTAFGFEGLDVRIDRTDRSTPRLRRSAPRPPLSLGRNTSKDTESALSSGGVVPRRGRASLEHPRDCPGCRARSRVPGSRDGGPGGGLAWRVNDSVQLILQLQLQIGKTDEPVGERGQREDALSPRP